MKKLILFISIISLVMTSCKSDDDDSSSSDLLIGTWTWHQSFINGVEETLDECDKMDSVIINSNGTLTEEYYYNNNGTCESDGSDSATWENIGNNVYRIVYDAGTSFEEIIEQTILFDGNTFYIEEAEGTDIYRVVYIRN